MSKAIFWFRRDLRWEDNIALARACHDCESVFPIFIFDENILSKLDKSDHRVNFILQTIHRLNEKFPISVYFGKPIDVIETIIKQHDIQQIYCNKDYEDYSLKRDSRVEKMLAKYQVKVNSFHDHLTHEPTSLTTLQGTPYKVYTPFKNKWLELTSNNMARIGEFKLKSKKMSQDLLKGCMKNPQLKDIGFTSASIPLPELDPKKMFKNFKPSINSYKDQRDLPSLDSTSKLSVHLRFGTISQRLMFRYLYENDLQGSTWASELIWREFFSYSLFHFPHSEKSEFNLKYTDIPWDKNTKNHKAFITGQTGYPIIDAGIRELLSTGYMHNRVRMVVASFYTKNLLLDWRVGEKFFAKYLYDFDKTANVGNWQWASSTGCDAQPYFRVFNPESQALRFDKEAIYIKKWCPELHNLPAKLAISPYNIKPIDEALYDFKIGKNYPEPLVDLKGTRVRAIAHFSEFVSRKDALDHDSPKKKS